MDVEKLESLCTAAKNLNGAVVMENSMVVPYKAKKKELYDTGTVTYVTK